MRLVKALRRRFVLITLIFVGTSACVDEQPVELTAADCEPMVRRPTSPRIVEVLPDGSLHPGPACATGNCLVGAPGAWGYRDDKATHLLVGERVLELPPPSPTEVIHPDASCMPQQFVVGNDGTVAIDRGAEIEIANASGSIRFPMPAFEANEVIAGVSRIDEGILLSLRKPKPAAGRHAVSVRSVALTPMKTPAPRAGVTPILAKPDRLAGWLLPGDPGAILLASGETLTLPMAVPPHAYAGRADDGRYVVTFDKRNFVINETGTLAAEIPSGVQLTAHEGVVYAINPRLPAAVHVVTDRGLEPWLATTPGKDLSGAVLPPGSRQERLELRAFGGHALAVERVRLRTCTVEDRLLFIDLAKKSIRMIAGGDVVRLHPTFAGDRFRFVEADATYSSD